MPDVITHLANGLFMPAGTYKGPGWYKYTWDGVDGKKSDVRGPFASWHQLLAADHLEKAASHLFLGNNYTPTELMAALKVGLAWVDGGRQSNTYNLAMDQQVEAQLVRHGVEERWFKDTKTILGDDELIEPEDQDPGDVLGLYDEGEMP